MGAGAVRYDAIGRSYVATRAEDPRIARAVWDALGPARTVVNVGAGTGSYEPADRAVVAVEPSPVMRAQRAPGAARCVAGRAEALPFADGAFDAALAVFSDHHWGDRVAGLRELRRVARERVVVLNWDPGCRDAFWLTRDYLRGFETGAERAWAAAKSALGSPEERVVPIPGDCRDGFLLAWWRRPEALLDPVVRANISVFALMGPDAEAAFVRALAADLEGGAWAERNGALLALDELDVGCRILIAR